MTEALIEKLQRERTIFWSLLTILVFCAGFYMYCVNSTIHNVVSRQNLETAASSLSLTIGSEEFKYITMRNKVDRTLAYSLGFKDVANKTFISQNAANQVSYLSH